MQSISELSKERLTNLYQEQRLSTPQIAAMFGVHKQKIYRLRWEWGIESVPRWSRYDILPTADQKQILFGSLLGDGHLSYDANSPDKQSSFQEKHCPKQKEYVFWKYERLANLCNSGPKETKNGQYRFRTRAHPYFTDLRKRWYTENGKHLTEKTLSEIGPLGIAVWFMDDGTNLNHGSVFRFATCAFSDYEHDLLVRWLADKYKIHTLKSCYSGYRILRVHKDFRIQFVELIRPHVPLCMEYKVWQKK